MNDTHEWREGSTLPGDFVVERELGHGGMGAVFLVKHELLRERYAAKRVLKRDLRARLAFVQELQAWIDLPQHPNLLELRFVRTVAEETIVFMDVAEGGSVHEWVEAEEAPSLPQILDVAIQMAWGLDCAHRAGIVHRDVKPANVLVSGSGVVKVSDFGLARLVGAAGVRCAAGVECTMAYRSPEQANGWPITVRSDVWSYAVSVLHLLRGERVWQDGAAGDLLLAAFADEGALTRGGTAVPERVLHALYSCLQPDVALRCDSLGGVAAELALAYETLTGSPYQPPAEQARPRAEMASGRDDRAAWWARAREALGPALAHVARSGSARAVAVLDATVLTELAQVLASRANTPARDMAELLEAKADAQAEIGDLPGAAFTMGEAWRWRAAQPDSVATQREQAATAVTLAASLHKAGRSADALEWFDRGFALCDRARRSDPGLDLLPVARDALHGATAMRQHLGDVAGAMAGTVKLVGLHRYVLTHLMDVSSHDPIMRAFVLVWRRGLVAALNNLGNLLDDTGETRAAAEAFAEALSVLEQVVADSPGDAAILCQLANTSTNRAVACSRAGDLAEAERAVRRALEVLEPLVARGDVEPLRELAASSWALARVLSQTNRTAEAVQVLDRALAALQPAVVTRGAVELTSVLVQTERRKADALAAAGRGDQSVATFDKAIEMLEQGVRLGRRELRIELAAAVGNKANALLRLGDAAIDETARLSQQCIELYEQLVTVEGMSQLTHELAAAYTRYARLLDPTQVDDALPLWRRVVELYASIIGREPQRLRPYVASREQLARLLTERNRYGEAREQYELVETALVRALAERPDRELERLRALVVRRVASMHVLAHDEAAALAGYREAIALLERQVSAGDTEAHAALLETRGEAAVAFKVLGNTARAVEFAAAMAPVDASPVQRGRDDGTPVVSQRLSDPVSRERAFCLELVSGLEPSWRQPKVFLLEGSTLRIGRVARPPAGADGDAAPNDIVLPAESVTRRHAVLESRGGTWWCRDRGSAGGTRVNSVKLGDADTRELPIAPGDLIQCGHRVTLVCRGEADGWRLLGSELPPPLARLESALRDSPDRFRQQQTIFLEFDRALRFLFACTLATVRARAQQDRALCERLAVLLSRSEIVDGRHLGMGTWLPLVSALSTLASTNAPGTFPKIASALADMMAALEPVVPLRNDVRRRPPNEAELTEAYLEMRGPLRALLHACASFSSMRLISVVRSENLVEGYRYDAYLLKGGEKPSQLTFESEARMLHRWAYLVDPVEDLACESPLLLAPLVAASEHEGGVRMLLARQLDLGPRTAKVTLKAIDNKDAEESLPIPWTRDIAALYEAIQARGR